MNVLLYSGYLTNIPVGIGRSSLCGGCEYMENILEDCFPDHETNACDSCSSDSTWYMERCNDTTRHHVRFRKRKYTSAGTADFQTQFGTNYNLAFASYLLALLPILIFYLICQSNILNGVVNGAVK